MEIIQTVLTDALVLKPQIFEDDRGYFFESFNNEDFNTFVSRNIHFVQDNQSSSSKGTLRGLHFQKREAAQTKLVRVTKGRAYDVAVDLRSESPTFKQWFGIELTAKNHLQFLIPKGFAHAFVALEDDTIFQYKVDNFYSGSLDGGVLWNDEDLRISWPAIALKLSEKDRALPLLNQLDLTKLW